MIDIKDAILLAYPPGGYGHFISWALNHYLEIGTKYDSNFPVDDTGGSHITAPATNYRNVANIDKVDYKFFHSHIFEEGTDFGILRDIISNTIIINFNSRNELQLLNNVFCKCRKSNIEKYIQDIYNCEDFISKSTWEDREYLSYKIQFTGGTYIDSSHLKNSIDFELSCFLYNFEHFITTIADYLDTKIINYDELLIHHKNMLAKQHHLNKDRNIKYFLKCFEDEIDCPLLECSIIDESFIQRHLRNKLNLEIKCNGLNIFPKTTAELRKITYPAEELKRLE